MTMVEKVARAILNNYPGQHKTCQERALRDARAALGALMEPNEEMRYAGRLAGEWRQDSDGDVMEGNADDVWQAMLKAALEEKPE